MEKIKEKVNLEFIISLVIVMVTVIGSTVPLYIHSSSQMDNLRVSTQSNLQAIQMEMKDFHGRLCALEEKYIQMMQRILEERK